MAMDYWTALLEWRLSKIEERLVMIGKRLECIEKERLENANRSLDDFRRDLRWFMGISTVI